DVCSSDLCHRVTDLVKAIYQRKCAPFGPRDCARPDKVTTRIGGPMEPRNRLASPLYERKGSCTALAICRGEEIRCRQCRCFFSSLDLNLFADLDGELTFVRE